MILSFAIIDGVNAESHAAQRAVLGINIAAGDPGSGPVSGVSVVGVTPGGPAATAGIEAGDVLMTINGESLEANSARAANRTLLRFMATATPGDKIAISYRRDNEVIDTTLAAGELDPEMMPGFPSRRDFGRLGEHFERGVVDPLRFRWRHYGIFAGMELVELSSDLGRYFGTDDGLLVVRAPDNEAISLKDGDVIQKIGGRSPKDPAHAMRIFRSYEPGETLVMNIVRDKRTRDLEVTLPEQPANPDAD